MSTKRTTTPTPAPAAAPTTPKEVRKEPAPTPRRSLLSIVHQAIDQMCKEDEAFLNELFADYLKGAYNLREVVFRNCCHALGFGWLGMEPQDDMAHAEDISTLVQILGNGSDDWMANFLQLVCAQFRRDPEKKFTPEDLLLMLETDLTTFHNYLDSTRQVLRENPEYVADALREVAAKRPELFSGDAA